VSQAGVVTWLAVRELWITFRLVIMLLAFIAIGAVVALLPAPLPAVMQRLALGFGAASLVVAMVAGWSLADERIHGRAGWLVTRSVARGTLLGGWFVALSAVALTGTVAASILGWLAARGVAPILDPWRFGSWVGAVAATVVAAVALGLLTGTLARPRIAVLLAATLALASGSVAWLLPVPDGLVPGSALVGLAAVTSDTSSVSTAWLATGAALLAAAILLGSARLLLERVDL
jgi:hypothetical protein